MNHPRTTHSVATCGAALLLALVALAGCKKSAPAEGAAAGAADPALVAQGKTVYGANGCANCHTIGTEGGHGGPNLSKVGGEADNTPEKLAAYVKQPRQGSRMPAFGGKINDADLKALGTYLASLK